MRAILAVLALLPALALADCDVTLFSLTGSQVVLKATCAAPVTGVEWLRDNASLTGGVYVGIPASTAEIYYTTNLANGVHRYTARANNGTQAPGGSVTIITGRPAP